MKINIVIKANESGYAYHEPEGTQTIDIEVSENVAEHLELREMVQAAVIECVREYKAQKVLIENTPKDED